MPMIERASLLAVATALKSIGTACEEVKWGARGALRCTASGMVFHMVPGSLAGDGFVDFSYVATFRAPTLPLDVVSRQWNSNNRFAQSYVREGTLYLQMDVLVAPGVTPEYLARTAGVWQRQLAKLLSGIAPKIAAPAAGAGQSGTGDA
ncbi:YbjN domain-containing protein [Xanthobacter sp. DSM 24535]|uniref:YbjN domain-containing protein n=1 Tax=Roseixanthobacter psychrophilus TaxID=3119917 RepID=UPI003728964C